MGRTILVVDDEEGIRSSLAGVLEDEGYTVITSSDGESGIEIARRDSPDLVLLDIWMPGIDGIETLQRLREMEPAPVVVMISGHGTIETAVKCTKLGAYDFIEKPLSLEKVVLTVRNALDTARLLEENRFLRGDMVGRCDLVGASSAVERLREQVRTVAGSDAPVLIVGEKGSGKEVVGQAIHRCSPRADYPYVILRCRSMPDQLLDAELFGYERGALPHGGGMRKGRLEIADQGTLFLADVSALSLDSQEKLARFIDDREFVRIGGHRRIPSSARLIASTSVAPTEGVAAGLLHPDLLARIPLDITVPPLRERLDDIPPLVERFIDDLGRREGGKRKQVSGEVLTLFGEYDWPGNIRELRNIVERLCIMTRTDMVTVDDLPDYLRELAPVPSTAGMGGEAESLRKAREQFEREFIRKRLVEEGWNVTRAAESLGVDRGNLLKKIRYFGIDVPHP